MPTPDTFHLIKFIAHIVHEDTGKPLAGNGYTVRFFDFDLLKDDALGESGLSAEGVAQIVCEASQFQTGLLGRLFSRLREQKPDIYIEVVGDDGARLYRSAVRWNVDPLKPDEVTGRVNPTLDLGVFHFRVGKGLAEPGLGSEIHRPMM